MRLSKE
jgi:hypothetical protein